MKIFLIIFFSLLLVTGTLYLFPEKMLSPGPLSQGHQSIGDNCFACHTLTKGVVNGKCISCHELSEIGVSKAKGGAMDTSINKSLNFHRFLKDKSCIGCHTDHKGAFEKGALKAFDHTALMEMGEKSCVSCHKKPEDNLHRKTSEKCMDCHSTEKWKPATFDHSPYFEFDRAHQTRCETCHSGNSYSEYSCYGCHEHSPSKIRKEHLEEGISNFNNCVECHRNGNEDSAKRNWKSNRSQNRGEGEYFKKDKKKKEHSSHEDDDEKDDED